MPAPGPRKPTFLQALIIRFLKLWDSTPFRWYSLPIWTLLPMIYPLLRREVLTINLIEIEQPNDTPLAKRLKKTKVPLAADQTPTTRLADAWGNDVEHPGAGSTGATIGRNMAEVPRALRRPAADPHPQLVAQKLLARRPTRENPTGFRPAGMQLNGLAANWIQTMIHDWQDHALSKRTTTVGAGGAAHGCPLARFTVHDTHDFAPAGGDSGSAYLNTRTGWWCDA
jgi:Animal haem peroxidase